MENQNSEMEEELKQETEAAMEETAEEAVTEAAAEAEEIADKKEKKKKDKKEKKEKKDKQEEEIAKLAEQNAKLTDQLLRSQAEFVNFRNRTEKEKAQMFEVGAKSILEKMLPVVDNFERGLSLLSEEQKQEPFAQGMDKIYKQMIQTLTDLGVTPIEAVGAEFNPDFHNAVMHIDDESFGENVVAEEFQKGYMYRESVLRHSMVKVAN